jgi:hypothetical protein
MSELITLDKFKQSIMNSMKTPGMQEGAAVSLAEHVLNFFGFQDRIIDNMLDPEDRDAFYMLEDVGLLTTEREETGLPDGREWRIHYWLIREDRILRALSAKNKNAGKEDSKAGTVYDTITDDIWFRRIQTDKEPEEPEEDDEDELSEDDWETPIMPGTIPSHLSETEALAMKAKQQAKLKEKLEGEEEIQLVSEVSDSEENDEE